MIIRIEIEAKLGLEKEDVYADELEKYIDDFIDTFNSDVEYLELDTDYKIFINGRYIES